MDMADERAEDAMPPTIREAKRRLGWLPRSGAPRVTPPEPARQPAREAAPRPPAPKRGPMSRRKSAPRKGKGRP
jgi:multicomponent Na+:H+ antiporter subunit C